MPHFHIHGIQSFGINPWREFDAFGRKHSEVRIAECSSIKIGQRVLYDSVGTKIVATVKKKEIFTGTFENAFVHGIIDTGVFSETQ